MKHDYTTQAFLIVLAIFFIAPFVLAQPFDKAPPVSKKSVKQIIEWVRPDLKQTSNEGLCSEFDRKGNLIAYYDSCNSLHTNAYDEAVTTPTEESVRRAMAIQMIIAREFGQAKNENPNQGAYVIEELTDLVEEAVLAEFERLTDRGGVLGAMETQYQRSKIQEESLHYERLKHTGELPLVGVNTFVDPDPEGAGRRNDVRHSAPPGAPIRGSDGKLPDPLREAFQ